MRNSITSKEPTIEDLKKDSTFWENWERPKLFEDVFSAEELSSLNEICHDLKTYRPDYMKRPNFIFPEVYKDLHPIVFPKIQSLFPWLTEDNIEGEVIRSEVPSNMHLDGTHWGKSYPAKTLLIPLHIETDKKNYKWAGTVFYKQNYINYKPFGYEWQLINDKLDSFMFNYKYKKNFGKGYDKFEEIYDNEGNKLEHHNNITVPDDFDGIDYLPVRKMWLRGLDFDSYINWIPGNVISFNPFVIHGGVDFPKDDIKYKLGIRVRLFKKF